MFKKNFASTLKRLRINSGLTAEQVGEQIGKSGKTVNGWENGRSQPDGDTFLKLCDIYKVKDIMQEFEYTVNSAKQKKQSVDVQKESLLKNYEALNEIGKNKLVEYSHDLVNSGNYSELNANKKRA